MERTIPEQELRDRFNAGQFYERTLGSEFKLIRRQNRVVPANSGLPEGTRSQIWAYCNSRMETIAIVHQYQRPDGLLGGYGKPDPKYLLDGGIAYRREEKTP